MVTKRANIAWKIGAGTIVASFLLSLLAVDLLKVKESDASIAGLPSPTQILPISKMYSAPMLKALKIDPQNPLNIDFVIDTQDQEDVSQEEAAKLVRYFLTGLTIHEDDLWVNLSPYEQNRVIDDSLSVTDVGRDMLAQDYVLKQLMSSLTYPESDTGKDFWDKTYKKLMNVAKTINVPVNTFNKVWIIPNTAVVYENNNMVVIKDSSLGVQLEEDYMAKNINAATVKDEVSKASSDVMKDIVLPEIEDDVNFGKNFAQLRQLHNSLILAKWFKTKFINSFYGDYIDKGKIAGVDSVSKSEKQKIYDIYVKAFEKGCYDYIKKEYDPGTKQEIQKRYFSGGVVEKFEVNSSTVTNQEFSQALAEEIVSSTILSIAVEPTKNGNNINDLKQQYANDIADKEKQSNDEDKLYVKVVGNAMIDILKIKKLNWAQARSVRNNLEKVLTGGKSLSDISDRIVKSTGIDAADVEAVIDSMLESYTDWSKLTPLVTISREDVTDRAISEKNSSDQIVKNDSSYVQKSIKKILNRIVARIEYSDNNLSKSVVAEIKKSIEAYQKNPSKSENRLVETLNKNNVFGVQIETIVDIVPDRFVKEFLPAIEKAQAKAKEVDSNVDPLALRTIYIQSNENVIEAKMKEDQGYTSVQMQVLKQSPPAYEMNALLYDKNIIEKFSDEELAEVKDVIKDITRIVVDKNNDLKISPNVIKLFQEKIKGGLEENFPWHAVKHALHHLQGNEITSKILKVEGFTEQVIDWSKILNFNTSMTHDSGYFAGLKLENGIHLKKSAVGHEKRSIEEFISAATDFSDIDIVAISLNIAATKMGYFKSIEFKEAIEAGMTSLKDYLKYNYFAKLRLNESTSKRLNNAIDNLITSDMDYVKAATINAQVLAYIDPRDVSADTRERIEVLYGKEFEDELSEYAINLMGKAKGSKFLREIFSLETTVADNSNPNITEFVTVKKSDMNKESTEKYIEQQMQELNDAIDKNVADKQLAAEIKQRAYDLAGLLNASDDPASKYQKTFGFYKFLTSDDMTPSLVQKYKDTAFSRFNAKFNVATKNIELTKATIENTQGKIEMAENNSSMLIKLARLFSNSKGNEESWEEAVKNKLSDKVKKTLVFGIIVPAAIAAQLYTGYATQSIKTNLERVFNAKPSTTQEVNISTEVVEKKNSGVNDQVMNQSKDDLGGIDLKNITVESMEGASGIKLKPIDLGDFKGFSFQITKLEKFEQSDAMLASFL